VLAPGFGMAGAGANGEILVDLGAVAQSYIGAPWAGPLQPAPFGFSIPIDLAFYGVPVFFQGALLDPTPGAAVPIGVTTGSRWLLGF
jgi:hypothetical protein